ncbi:MFS general substrate transporter [Rhizoctonia solani]|uniref:MFS general substrate transporter n=1 Tax=Rhizoctonia solani TaxID=456999 RepID=A0A8H7LXK3_9AGAM|nr:MFS general substrate transporter [Rhizoctonia solani]
MAQPNSTSDSLKKPPITVSMDEASINNEDIEDRALMRKVDWNLLPILTSLYLLSFLDRANIGNAKLDGLTTDTGVTGANYNTALALYFVGYVIWEVPANIVLKRFNPKVWLPTLTLAWGIVSICQGFVKNQAGLFAVRFFLGTAEAGLILAWAIGKMNGVGGQPGWAWDPYGHFAIAAYWLVPNWPERASFLTEREKARLIARLKHDSAGVSEQFKWKYVREALTDHLVWAYAFLFHGFACKSDVARKMIFIFLLAHHYCRIGVRVMEAQLFTVPPYALSAICIAISAWLASVYNRRAIFIIGSAIIGIIGYILLLATNTVKLGGNMWEFILRVWAGVYTGNALLLSWPGENVAPQTKRAVAVAMQISIGDLGAIAGVLIYRPEWSANRFRKPHIISIGYLVFALVVTVWLWVWMTREQAAR